MRTGAANTLVRVEGGWLADNTDVHGITAALAVAGCDLTSDAVAEVVVVGSGATARSAIAAVAAGAGERAASRRVTLMVRDEARPETLAQARATGLVVDVARLGDWPDADVVISTVPDGHGPAARHAPDRRRRSPAGAARRRLRRRARRCSSAAASTAGGPWPAGSTCSCTRRPAR